MIPYTIRKDEYAYCTWWGEFTARNSKNERIEFSISKSSGDQFSEYWYKRGYTKTKLKDWWSVDVYVYNEKGQCFRGYDPTVKPHEDGRHGLTLNFDWVLEATEENMNKLINEIAKRAFGL